MYGSIGSNPLGVPMMAAVNNATMQAIDGGRTASAIVVVVVPERLPA